MMKKLKNDTDIFVPKCKRPSKNFYLRYFPREPEWAINIDNREHKFDVDVFIHIAHNEKNRTPYVLIYDKSLEWSFAVDVNMKLYGYKNYLSKDILEKLLYKLKINRENIIDFWNDKNADEEDFCENLKR